MSLTKASFSMINGAVFNVLDYGADNTGVADCTSAFQAAIDAAQPTHATVYIPTGTYLVNSTVTVYNGTQIRGETWNQYPDGYGRLAKATTINFSPTTLTPLFDYEWSANDPPPVGFVFHTSIKNLRIKGNSYTTAQYALKLNSVIYGLFENLSITNFTAAIYCSSTIDNRFCNIFAGDGVTGVLYAGGNETTDVWDSCTFNGVQVGIDFLGSSIAIRFTDCLWEQCDVYGMRLAKECQNIEVVSGYCEDVPFLANPDGAMFRVGATGTTLVTENQLTVIGGKWTGRNAGSYGNWLDVDYANGVLISNVNVSRFPYVIRTTANTLNGAVVVSGVAGISWTGFSQGTTGKIKGMLPSGVINSGSYNQVFVGQSLFASSYVAAPSVYLSSDLSGAVINSGLGSPEGATTAPVGSLWCRTNGGAGTTLYVKESGTGNTGWVAK
jgi:hypothetical protein